MRSPVGAVLALCLLLALGLAPHPLAADTVALTEGEIGGADFRMALPEGPEA